jgi:hypothetical protein
VRLPHRVKLRLVTHWGYRRVAAHRCIG